MSGGQFFLVVLLGVVCGLIAGCFVIRGIERLRAHLDMVAQSRRVTK